MLHGCCCDNPHWRISRSAAIQGKPCQRFHCLVTSDHLSRDEVFRWIKSSTVILSRGEVSHVIIMRNLLTAMRYRIQPSERIVRLSCRS